MIFLNQRQIETFINRWFSNTGGNLESGSIISERLIQELRNKPQIKELAKTQSLLELICQVYQKSNLTLPAIRTQFYKEAVDYLLTKQHTKQDYQQNNENVVIAKIQLLEFLAYQFSHKGKVVFSFEDLQNEINLFLYIKNPINFDNKTAIELIQELCEHNGIIQKVARDSQPTASSEFNSKTTSHLRKLIKWLWAFITHFIKNFNNTIKKYYTQRYKNFNYVFLDITFQHYFLASYYHRLLQDNLEGGIVEIKKYFWHFNLHEYFSFLAGLMENPISLIEAITQENDDAFWSMLLLAGQCVAECEESNNPLIVEVTDKIYELWLSNLHFDFVRNAIITLGRSSSVIRERLENALQESESYVGYYAAEALGKISSPETVSALISAFYNNVNNSCIFMPNPNTFRRQVVRALGNIGTTESVATLISILLDVSQNYMMRMDAAEALGKIGTPEAISALPSVLLDNEWQVRRAAAEALGEIGTPEAVNILTSGLQHIDKEVRRAAAVTLGYLGRPEAIPALTYALYSDPTVGDLAARSLGEIGTPEVVPALIYTLQNSNLDIKFEAIRAMGKVGGTEIINVLLFILKDYTEHPVIKEQAARSLGNLGRPEVVDILSQLLYSTFYMSSDFHAVEGLEKIGTPEAISALSKALQSFDWSTDKIKIAKVLGKLGKPEAIDVLITALQDVTNNVDLNGYLRGDAAEALEEIGTLEILERLLQLPKDFLYIDDFWLNDRPYPLLRLIRKLVIRFCKEKVQLPANGSFEQLEEQASLRVYRAEG